MKNKNYIDDKAREFLAQVRENLDADSQMVLDQNQLVFEDADFYLRKNIKAASGTLDLIQRSDSEKTGTRNIDRSELPSLQNLILKGLVLSYAVGGASTTDPAVVSYSSKKPSTAVPALQNGELIIEQDDKPVLQIPVERFFSAADSDEAFSEKEAIWLDNWRLIKAQRPFKVKIKFAEGQAVSDANTFVSVHLLGTKTRKR